MISFIISANEKEKQKVTDVAKQRLQLVQRRNKDVYEAVMWLRENKHRFRHHIYEPMILEVRFLKISLSSNFEGHRPMLTVPTSENM